MSRPVSRAAIVAAIMKKDFREFSRDRLYVFLSLLGLVAYVVLFWVVPSTVDETITLGAYLGPLAERIPVDATEGVEFVGFDSPGDLEKVIAGDLEYWRTAEGGHVLRDAGAGDAEPDGGERVDVRIGIALPDDFAQAVAAGRGGTVTVYSDVDVPAEVQGGMAGFVRELAYTLAGDELPVRMPEQETIVLGRDRAGDQVSLRERMRPMLAFFVLMIETFALASLIAGEVAARTITAILVTPARLSDVLAAKTVYGTILAFSQAVVLLVAVDAFSASNWLLLLVAVLLGSVMFTGIAMLVGSAGKDFLGTLFYGLLFLVPLVVPGIAVLFPGTAAAWVKALPTYGLIRVLNGATAYGEGFGDVTGALGLSLAWVVALYLAGLYTLKRKVETL